MEIVRRPRPVLRLFIELDPRSEVLKGSDSTLLGKGNTGGRPLRLRRDLVSSNSPARNTLLVLLLIQDYGGLLLT